MARSKTKTNAVRIIEAKKIPYQVYEYEAPDGFFGWSVGGQSDRYAR